MLRYRCNVLEGPLQKSLPLSVPPQLGLLFDSAEELGVPRNGEMVYFPTDIILFSFYNHFVLLTGRRH